jgi:hypothetical protein
MQHVILLDKANKHFTRFIELLRTSPEVRIVDIKKVIPRSMYYGVVVRKLLDLNKALRGIRQDFYLAEPAFSVTGGNSVFTCVRRCAFIEIESKPGFFLIRCKDAPEKKDHPAPRHPGAARAHPQ